MTSLQQILFALIVLVLILIVIVGGILQWRKRQARKVPSIGLSSIPLDKNLKRPYAFQEYDPTWSSEFEEIKNRLAGIFEGKALSIEHVGSTSIPGMKAKPVIDVLITVRKIESFMHEKMAMKALGYEWGDNYIAPGTIVFFKELPNGQKTENIHVCEDGSPKARQFIYMRDFFREHPEKARQYSDLKKELSDKHPKDYPSYRLGKKVFLDQMEHEAYEWMKATHPEKLRSK
jgi:GrpB-like predicted nucleotidyltransferase (UPF0157 family)